jgi:hypothetical protein
MKLKTIIATALIAGTMFSCGNQNQTPAAAAPAPAPNSDAPESKTESVTNAESSTKTESKASAKINPYYTFLLGTWKGNLRDKKLTIVIENINGDEVTGYNIAGSNKRPITGVILPDDRNPEGECAFYKLILKEPGDDQWDGFFTIYFSNCVDWDENHENETFSRNGSGEWKAFSGKLSGDVHVSK